MGNNHIQENGNHPLGNSSSKLDHADNHSDEEEESTTLMELQKENDALREQLAALALQKVQLYELKQRTRSTQDALEQRVHAAWTDQEQAFAGFQSAIADRRHKERQLQTMQQWNNFNDCFYISTQGSFATINGLRLGAEAVTENFDQMNHVEHHSPTLVRKSATNGSHNQNNNNNNTKPVAKKDFPRRPFSSSSGGGGVGGGGDSSNGTHTSSRDGLLVPKVVSVKVPWSEINSALGQLALLLSVLESTSKSSSCFRIRYRHEILCMGSTSKMGIRRNNTTPSYYNLYSDDSFQFFGRRNFNTALNCLLQCVLDAAECIRQRDPTIAMPHPIEKADNAPRGTGELTVGGLSVTYGTDAVEWTRAMKYLLTNVKHLLLFPPLSLWDISTSLETANAGSTGNSKSDKA